MAWRWAKPRRAADHGGGLRRLRRRLRQRFGPDSLFLAGAVAATLVTWFTFLPSFIFILAGGPLVETTHNDLKFTAPLTAITAAVVGVILNLALFFGYHVLWPKGFAGTFDWISALLRWLPQLRSSASRRTSFMSSPLVRSSASWSKRCCDGDQPSPPRCRFSGVLHRNPPSVCGGEVQAPLTR
jgi:hypothetical protein